MKYFRDGTPISYSSIVNNQVKNKFSGSEVCKLSDFLDKTVEFSIATIREVYYIDDINNKSGNQVEYKIRIETGERRGQEYPNVQCRDIFGGVVNFQEIIFNPKVKHLKDAKNNENITHQSHDAAQVLVGFLDGASNLPVILTGLNHSTKSPNFSAKKEDGIRFLQEFNGIREEINKDGEYILTYNGGPRDTKPTKSSSSDPVGFNEALAPNTAPTTLKIDKTGVFSIDDKENQLFEINRVTKQISLEQWSEIKPNELPPDQEPQEPDSKLLTSIVMDKTNKTITNKVRDGENDQVTEVLDGTNEKITLTFKTGMVLTIDGKNDIVNIVTKGGALLKVDGTNDNIQAKDAAGGELNIKAGKVALGGSSAELLQQISDALNKILTWANSVGATHTHLGNLGYPTAVPGNAAQYTQLGTDLTTIKGLVDGIKGTL